MHWRLSKHTKIHLQVSPIRLTFAECMSWKILCYHIPLMLIICHLYPLEIPCHTSVLSQMRSLTDTCSDGSTSINRSDRPHQLVRPVPPVMQHQTSRTCLPPHSQIHQLIMRNFLPNVKMIWLR